MMPSFVVLHPLQLPAGRDLTGPHITKGITWSNRLARLSILILSKTYPSVITTSPTLRHERLYGHWISFAEK
jgi:hypothetical protein